MCNPFREELAAWKTLGNRSTCTVQAHDAPLCEGCQPWLFHITCSASDQRCQWFLRASWQEKITTALLRPFLCFSLNLTTLFHAFTHLLLYSPKPGMLSQFITARCRRKHRDSSMDNENWMVLSGAHFLSIKYSVAALCGFKTIAL